MQGTCKKAVSLSGGKPVRKERGTLEKVVSLFRGKLRCDL